MFQLTVWSLPSLAAVILAGYTLLLVRRSPNVPGVTPMLALCACVMIWSGGQLLGTLVTTPALKMLALKLQVPGIAYLTVCWFWFALAYARRRRHVSTPVLVAVSILPTVSLVLALTNEWHQLVWQSPHVVEHNGYVGWVASQGPWLMVHVVYAYALLFAATVILAFELSSSTRYRKALVAVIAAPAVTAGLNLLSLSGWYALPGFDLTTFGFALSALLLNDGVLRFGLLEVTPAIRNRVVEQLTDGVVVIQKDGRIIDLNPAAAATFAIRGRLLGESVCDELHQDAAVAGTAGRALFECRSDHRRALVPRARDAAVTRHRRAGRDGAGAARHHGTDADQAGDGAPRAHRLPDRPRESPLLHAATARGNRTRQTRHINR